MYALYTTLLPSFYFILLTTLERFWGMLVHSRMCQSSKIKMCLKAFKLTSQFPNHILMWTQLFSWLLVVLNIHISWVHSILRWFLECVFVNSWNSNEFKMKHELKTFHRFIIKLWWLNKIFENKYFDIFGNKFISLI